MDPNRSFYSPSPCDEAGTVVDMIKEMNLKWLMHVDLHETTDSDFSEFIPAKAARDGVIEFEREGSTAAEGHLLFNVSINYKIGDLW